MKKEELLHDYTQLVEDLKSIRNSIDTSLLIIEYKRADLLATSLEDMFLKAQGVLDEHCVVRYEPTMRIRDVDKPD